MKTIRKAILGFSLSAISILSNSPAQALTWNLYGVYFDNAANATGSFDYVASTNTYSNVDIIINYPTLPGFTSPFTSNNISSSSNSSQLILCVNGDSCGSTDNSLGLIFQTPLSDNEIPENQDYLLVPNPGIYATQYSYYGTPGGGGLEIAAMGGVYPSAASVPFDFPTEGIALTIPLFLGLREFQKRKSRLTKV